MQRFKKELLRSPYSQPRARYGFHMADANSKFAYKVGEFGLRAQWRAWNATLLNAAANLRRNRAMSMSRKATQDAKAYRALAVLVFAG